MERILVTGASRGIGRAIAAALATPGRELLLVGRDRGALAATCAAVRERGASAVDLACDLAEPDRVLELCAAVGEGPLYAVVNNAGGATVRPIGELALDEWQATLAVGVTAPFLLAKGLVPRMKRGACIVNVLSVAARRGFPGWTAYCAAKHALEGLARALREEVRDRGIRVINVYPTATATALWDGVPGNWPRERMLDVEQVAEAVRFAVERPADVLVDEIHLGHIGGTL